MAEQILAANIIHSGLVDVGYTMDDATYDKLLKDNQYDATIEVTSNICTIFSIPKVNQIKYPFPILTSAKLDGACLVFHFVNNIMVNALTKSVKDHPQLLSRFKPLFKINLPYKEIVIRCELVAKDKTNVPTITPASLAAGAINCVDEEKFNSSIQLLKLVMVEIPWYITTLDEKVVPTQEEAFSIGSQLPIETVQHSIVNSIEEFNKQQETYLSSAEPCDGIVYSLPTWKYPESGVNKSVNYGKYAVKDSQQLQSTVLDKLEYSIGIDGLLACSVFFEPIKHNNTTYKQCKYPISRINTGEIGPGAIIALQFQSGQFPNITGVMIPSKQPFPQVTTCPYCSYNLKISGSGACHCENPDCKGIRRVLLQKFIKYFNVGIGAKAIEALTKPTLKVLNDTNKKMTDMVISRITNMSNREFYIASSAHTPAKLRAFNLSSEFLSEKVSYETVAYLKQDIKYPFFKELIEDIVALQ